MHHRFKLYHILSYESILTHMFFKSLTFIKKRPLKGSIINFIIVNNSFHSSYFIFSQKKPKKNGGLSNDSPFFKGFFVINHSIFATYLMHRTKTTFQKLLQFHWKQLFLSVLHQLDHRSQIHKSQII